MENKVDFYIYEFPCGFIKIEYTDKEIIGIERVFPDDNSFMGIPSKLSETVILQLTEYFNGERKVFDFPFSIKGTEFQKKVFKALLDIPYGETRTYKEIAEKIGNPKASRAVGMANHNNPISIAVPCHRVIGKNGKLIGYAGGLDMKEFLLQLEMKNKD